jgi:signal transduction histidine kinase
VWFGDVTDASRQQERLTAIVRAASSVADAGSLRATLDEVAREIVKTTGIAAVQILAVDDPRDDLRVLGMAGFGEAADFVERLSACRRLGARVRFMDAFQAGKPVVVQHRKSVIMADPAWAPLHAIMGHPDWDGFVSMPLVVRGRTLGVINAYYVPGEDPGPSSLDFLEAMADHAAVAIDTATLLAQTRSQAQLDERRRLARDLHDSVVQQLFSMGMQATALRAQVDRPDADPLRVRRGAEELAELSKSALADLRGLVFELRPLDLAERGLVDAVRAHAAGLEARTGLVVDVEAPQNLELESAMDVQEDLYRIVQEALHNVVKHAGATAVDIRFGPADGGGLVVEVTDDGRGLGAASASSAAGGAPGDTLGLVSMGERTQRWGGRLVAGPRPAGGWTVRVTLPAPGARMAADGRAGNR